MRQYFLHTNQQYNHLIIKTFSVKADCSPAFTNASDERMVCANMENFLFGLVFFYSDLNLLKGHCEVFHARGQTHKNKAGLFTHCPIDHRVSRAGQTH